MAIQFSPRQKELVQKGKTKGFITKQDLTELYSDKRTAQNIIDRFIALNIFHSAENEKYNYIGGKVL